MKRRLQHVRNGYGIAAEILKAKRLASSKMSQTEPSFWADGQKLIAVVVAEVVLAMVSMGDCGGGSAVAKDCSGGRAGAGDGGGGETWSNGDSAF